MAESDKISTTDDSLKINQAKPRRLKRGPVILVVALAFLVIIGAFTIAMLREPLITQEEEESLVKSDDNRLPGFIRTGPKDYSEIPKEKKIVPKLGRPLEGDFGKLGVTAKKQIDNKEEEQLSQEEIERLNQLKQAREADVFFQNINTNEVSAAKRPSSTTEQKLAELEKNRAALRKRPPRQPHTPSLPKLNGSWEKQNQQEEKAGFLKTQAFIDNEIYVKKPLSSPLSPYEIKAGSIIPIKLLTGINSDLPGEIIGKVRENVYDTATGNHLLIPQGSITVGLYDSGITFGQDSVLAVWHRIVLPNTKSISLEGMQGVDLSGYAGYSHKVDRHWLQLSGGVVLSSLLSVAVTSSQGSFTNTDVDLSQGFVGNAGRDINKSGQKIVDKLLNRQPTITIAPGYAVNILVNKDLIIEPYNDKKGSFFESNPTTNQN